MGSGAQVSRIGRLTRRPEFLAVAGARRKWVASGLIVQARRHDDRQRPAPGEPTVRLGLTASRKVGNAVARNRARRRLRALAQELLPRHAVPGVDLVLIARAETLTRAFADLRADLITALRRLGAFRDISPPSPPAAVATAADPAVLRPPAVPRP